MRKPFQLAAVLLAIILCSWMMDATLLDVDSGINTSDPRQSAGPHDAHAYHASGSALYRQTAWNRSLSESETILSTHLFNAEGLSDENASSRSNRPDITTIILLGYGILGIVGFWRRVMR